MPRQIKVKVHLHPHCRQSAISPAPAYVDTLCLASGAASGSYGKCASEPVRAGDYLLELSIPIGGYCVQKTFCGMRVPPEVTHDDARCRSCQQHYTETGHAWCPLSRVAGRKRPVEWKAPQAGLEPAIPGLEVRRSVHLSHWGLAAMILVQSQVRVKHRRLVGLTCPQSGRPLVVLAIARLPLRAPILLAQPERRVRVPSIHRTRASPGDQ